MKFSGLIDPVNDLGSVLLGIEKPARYVGGEYGEIYKEHAEFRVGIAFPDLYEIGMSNQALRILYNGLNRIDGVACERVFAPAPDFEDALKKLGLPLYTLERGAPLHTLDMLGITMGYELGITGALAILHSGGIPIMRDERSADHPIVIMGGPAASNPEPFSQFVDAVWVGEAEAGFFDLVASLKDLKRTGADRNALLERMSSESAVWVPGKKARRAVYSAFASDSNDQNIYPIASMKIVQDHGAVEIMRGCPNGCRFCHAGLWYRPMRQKSETQVRSEVASFIKKGGYREITLSSLSSGDYSGIDHLITGLNKTYADSHVSFQLPSLKISTFSLSLLEQLSEVRKSGLTFAVETPVDSWQLAINKDVSRENVVSILREAKGRGWRSAKFYFMIGLPVEDSEHRSEEEEIVDFLLDISRKVNVQINVNVGTFVPKAHTPYQWAPQLSEAESARKLSYIKGELRHGNFKVGTHDPFTSTLEGVISRGDKRVGNLIAAAFNAGCRLDAWDDYIKRDIWRDLLEENQDVVSSALSGYPLEKDLPWDEIDCGVGRGFLKREYQRSVSRTFTSTCEEKCTLPCGVCRADTTVVRNSAHDDLSDQPAIDPIVGQTGEETSSKENLHPDCFQILFSFTKSGPAAFIPHLSVIEVFSKAFVRASLPVKYTEGFNPLPKINFAAPLSVGVIADSEIAVIEMSVEIPEQAFIDSINRVLPEGFTVEKAYGFTIPEGVKKVSAAAILWGFSYLDDGKDVLVPATEEKKFRLVAQEQSPKDRGLCLHRTGVLAKQGDTGSGGSYFDTYARLYERYRK